MLVVDDDAAVCRAIARTLRGLGYQVDEATSAAIAVARLRASVYELMVCDVHMPGVSGLELMSEALALDEELAVIMLTGAADAATATAALRGGALHYLTKPVQLDDLSFAVADTLRARTLRIEQRRVERVIREEVMVRTAELEQRSLQLEERQRALQRMTVSVAESLINAMEAKDVYLRGHSQRVAALAAAIAEALELGADDVEEVRLAGRLHDVGKIGIREAVLNKPDRLAPEEYAHVQEHVVIGMGILAPLTHLGPVLTYVHQHHEHWDGGGYPHGLRGEAITLGGRILAAADTFDALTSARAYRAPLGRDAAVAMLLQQRGRLLAPEVLDALLRVVGQGRSLVFLDTA